MKKVLLILAAAPFFLIGCSSSDSSDPAPSGDTLLVKSFAVDYTNGDTDENYLYTYDGSALKTVKNNGELIQEYLYTNGKLTRVNFLDEGTYTLIEYNGSGQVSQFINYDTDFESATKTVITYSGNNFTRTIYEGDLDTQTDLQGTEVVTVQNGNIMQQVRTFGTTETDSYTYDNKNNAFKSISNYDIFKVLDVDISGSPNNPVTVTFLSMLHTLTYTYNASDYPLTQVWKNSDNSVYANATYVYY